ncbi:MAG: helix-turn-helix domain-containing protein [Microcoleus sp.]
MDNPRFVISRNIRHRRIYLGLTQSRVAATVNYSNVWLSHVENGRGSIPAECLPAIARELKTTITDLYIPGRFYVDD